MRKSVAIHAGARRAAVLAATSVNNTGDMYDNDEDDSVCIYASKAVSEQARLLFRFHTLLLAPIPDKHRLAIINALVSSPVAGSFLAALAALLYDGQFALSYSLGWLAVLASHHLAFHPRFAALAADTALLDNAAVQLKASSSAALSNLDSADGDITGNTGTGASVYPLYAALVHFFSDLGATRNGIAVLSHVPLLPATLHAVYARELRRAPGRGRAGERLVSTLPLAALAKDLLLALSPGVRGARTALAAIAAHRRQHATMTPTNATMTANANAALVQQQSGTVVLQQQHHIHASR